MIFTALLLSTALAQPPDKAQVTRERMAELGRELEKMNSITGHYPADSSWIRLRDGWGREFKYTSTGDRYELISYGADGREGGENDNRDFFAGR